MCVGISCEVGRHGDEIRVWFGDPAETSAKRDSHTAIRKFHKFPEITLGNWRRTPIEFHPVDSWEDAARWHLHFDARKPDWWDDECEAFTRAELQGEINRRLTSVKNTKVWPGSITEERLTIGVPWEKIGGDVYARESVRKVICAIIARNAKGKAK